MKTHIRINKKLISIITFVILLILTDIAEAQYGGARRRTRRRTAVIVSSATHAKDQEAQQQAAQQDTATKTAEKAQTTQKEPAQAEHLPIGTVVSTLPEGCEPVVSNDVQYYHCGNDYYRTAYQGNNLVYVTTEPPK